MKTKTLRFPLMLLLAGAFAIAAFHMFSNIVRVPVITEQEFPFSVDYALDGENQKLEGTYRCTFNRDSGTNTDPTERYYDGIYVETAEEGTIFHTIAEENGLELVLYMEFQADYLMGDPYYDDYYEDYPYEPRLLVYDEEGYEYDDEETISRFHAEIIDWEFPEPIENTLVFSHIGRVSVNSIFPMLLAAYLILIACVILVRKEKDLLLPKRRSIVSAGFNVLISLAVAPWMAVIASLTQIYTSGEHLIDQVFYCLPALTVWCVALSVCLRRKGYSAGGLWSQFAGPILFIISLFLEPI